MIQNRYFNSFFLTLAIFCFLIFATFILINKEAKAITIQKTDKISFKIVSPKPIIPPKIPIEEAYKEPIKEIEPIIEKPIEKIVEKKTTKPKKEKPKDIAKTSSPKEQKPQEIPLKEPLEISKNEDFIVVEEPINQVITIDIEAIKSDFLQTIKHKINQNKVYPKRAVSRRIQGEVDVKFKLSQNGTVFDINIEGHNIFKSSIEDALYKSFPINIPKELDVFPMVISFTIAFHLR
ncbi:MAG: hypothetical protein GX118_01215 [Arcobacter butzleri]|nr:hypothetical protein [Aliarcobacter butzleri]